MSIRHAPCQPSVVAPSRTVFVEPPYQRNCSWARLVCQQCHSYSATVSHRGVVKVRPGGARWVCRIGSRHRLTPSAHAIGSRHRLTPSAQAIGSRHQHTPGRSLRHKPAGRTCGTRHQRNRRQRSRRRRKHRERSRRPASATAASAAAASARRRPHRQRPHRQRRAHLGLTAPTKYCGVIALYLPRRERPSPPMFISSAARGTPSGTRPM